MILNTAFYVQFAVFVLMAVVIHEGAHAVQARLSGHKVGRVKIGWLPLTSRQTGGLLAVIAGVMGGAYFGWAALGMVVALAGAGLMAAPLGWGNGFLIKIPLGVGMPIEHSRRDVKDIVMGSFMEAGWWLLCGAFINPFWFWLAPTTILVNLVPWFPFSGGNDGMCLLREIKAIRSHYDGVVEV